MPVQLSSTKDKTTPLDRLRSTLNEQPLHDGRSESEAGASTVLNSETDASTDVLSAALLLQSSHPKLSELDSIEKELSPAQKVDAVQSPRVVTPAVIAPQQTDLSNVAPAHKKRPTKKIALGVSFGLVAASVAMLAWQHFSAFETTDDAFITGHIIPVSARIEDNVEKVLIDDNQHVKAGQLLFELDPSDFQKKVDEARAELQHVREQDQVARANVSLAAKNADAAKLNATGDYSSTASAIEKAKEAVHEANFEIQEQQQVLIQKQAELKRADLDHQRFIVLEREGAISTSQRDAARRDYDVAKAGCEAVTRAISEKVAMLKEANHQLAIAKALNVQSKGNEQTAEAKVIEHHVSELETHVSSAAIGQAEAKLRTALQQLSYTKVYAPVAGRVGRKTIEVGQRVQPGGRLFTLTADDVWVVANFKENQLERMEVGQPVELEVDSLPHQKFVGTVDSFSPGSGAQFTLLPPDNATGNFTKIVQRIPVKVRFASHNADKFLNRLVPGLSVVATVRVRK